MRGNLLALGAVTAAAVWLLRRVESPPQQLRPWAVVVLGLLALAAQLVIAVAMVGTIVLAHVVYVVSPLAGLDVEAPVTDLELLTALLGTPQVIGPLAVLAAAGVATVALGRAPAQRRAGPSVCESEV